MSTEGKNRWYKNFERWILIRWQMLKLQSVWWHKYLSNLQLYFDKRTDSDIKPPVDEVDEVCKTSLSDLLVLTLWQQQLDFIKILWWREAPSRTDILLRDGVRPSVVSKHLISQADYTMPFNIAHL